MEIVVYQSAKDHVPIEFGDWIWQVHFSKDDISWLKQNNIKVNAGTEEFESEVPLEVNGRTIKIDEKEINRKNHGRLFKYIIDILQGKEETSSSETTTIVVADDPNIKYGPEGNVSPGQKLDYKIEYENEGEGIAFGVYITDILDEDLNGATLIFNDEGIYDPSTRTITWLIGQVNPHQGGSVSFSVNFRADAPPGTDVINYATIYFPSVPEITRTNGLLSIYPDLTSIDEDGIADAGSVPTRYALEQNHPNPFNPYTTLKYQIPQECHMTLKIYNTLGREVKTLIEKQQSPGYYAVQWDGRKEVGTEVSSGIYFYRIQAGTYVQTKRMLLLK